MEPSLPPTSQGGSTSFHRGFHIGGLVRKHVLSSWSKTCSFRPPFRGGVLIPMRGWFRFRGSPFRRDVLTSENMLPHLSVRSRHPMRGRRGHSRPPSEEESVFLPQEGSVLPLTKRDGLHLLGRMKAWGLPPYLRYTTDGGPSVHPFLIQSIPSWYQRNHIPGPNRRRCSCQDRSDTNILAPFMVIPIQPHPVGRI